MFNMPMVSMARTPEEVKEEKAEIATKEPKYYYGMCISMDDECLEKLGLDGPLPPVGAKIMGQCLFEVTSATEHKTMTAGGGEEVCKRVELQITDMCCPPTNGADQAVAMSAARQGRWYSHAEPDGDE